MTTSTGVLGLSGAAAERGRAAPGRAANSSRAGFCVDLGSPGGLVEEHDGGILQHRSGDRDALLLAP